MSHNLLPSWPLLAAFLAASCILAVTPGPGVLYMVTRSLVVAIAAVTDTAYAITASAMAPTLTRADSLRSLGRYASGGMFIGLGLLAAFSEARARQ